MSQQDLFEKLTSQVGEEVYVGEWHQVTQDMIDAFARVTGDHQWIHVDVERARRELPWHSTIAHGYLTLSLLPMLRGMGSGELPYPGVKQGVNYGLDKLRFPNVVKAGARVRARCKLLRVEQIPGGLQVTEQFTAEIEGEHKPGCVADAIVRLYFH
jgi:acyl dehydratase